METAVLYLLLSLLFCAWLYEFSRARVWREVAGLRLRTAEHWRESANMFKAAYEEQHKMFEDFMSDTKSNVSRPVITRTS